MDQTNWTSFLFILIMGFVSLVRCINVSYLSRRDIMPHDSTFISFEGRMKSTLPHDPSALIKDEGLVLAKRGEVEKVTCMV